MAFFDVVARRWRWIAVAALATLILGYWYWTDSRSEVSLLPGGKAVFYRAGFFHRDRLDLTRFRGKWHLSSANGLDGGELIVPSECPYNQFRTLRIEDNGKVFVLDRETMTRFELRVVDGEWSYDAGCPTFASPHLRGAPSQSAHSLRSVAQGKVFGGWPRSDAFHKVGVPHPSRSLRRVGTMNACTMCFGW